MNLADKFKQEEEFQQMKKDFRKKEADLEKEKALMYQKIEMLESAL